MIVTNRVRSHIVNPEEPEKLVFSLANLPGFRNFIELIDLYHEWVNDVLWKLLCIFVWLQESETAPSPPPTFAYLKAKFFRLFISNHNRCLASETALRHQIERSWGYRLHADDTVGWSTVVFIMQRVGIDILFKNPGIWHLFFKGLYLLASVTCIFRLGP